MHKKQSPHPSLIDVKLWAEKSDTALHRHLFFLIPERKKEGKERRKEGEKVREIRAALLKRVLLPSVLRATGPSGRADHSFVHSVPSVISLSEKDKSGRRRLCTSTGGEESH